LVGREFAIGIDIDAAVVPSKATLVSLVPSTLHRHIDFVDFYNTRIAPISHINNDNADGFAPLIAVSSFVTGAFGDSRIVSHVHSIVRCPDGTLPTDFRDGNSLVCGEQHNGIRYRTNSLKMQYQQKHSLTQLTDRLIIKPFDKCAKVSEHQQSMPRISPIHLRSFARTLGGDALLADAIVCYHLIPIHPYTNYGGTVDFGVDGDDQLRMPIVSSALGHLHGKIDSIHESVKPLRMTKDAPLMTPNQQRSIYQVPTAQRATNSTNRQMVWGTGTYGYSTADLSMFYSKYDVAGNVSSVSMLGYQGNPNGANWGEATLDVQYISSVGLGVATIVANTDNATSSESSGGFGPGFLEFAAALANDPKPPHVVSLRYDCARTRTHSRTAPLALALPLPLPNASIDALYLVD
jgi:hypothetical protein